MKRPHILIVDDEIDIRMTLETILRAEGYRVSSATLGKTALEMISQDQPDLILLDIMMPDIDGYEICRKLKENEKTRGIKIVFATAMRKTKNKVEGLDIGADDYVTKPFNIPELLAKLRVHFRVMDYHRKFETLAEFAHNVNALNLEAIADALKNELEILISADRYSVFILNEESGRFRLIAHNHDDKNMDGLEVDIDKSPFMAETLRRMEDISESEFSRSRYLTQQKREKYQDDFAMCIPLKVGPHFLGVLNLNGNSKGFFDNLEFDFIALITEILSSSLNNVRQLEKLRKLARTDGLTSLFNHKVFHERLSSEFERSKRFDQPLSCLMVDIDHFKKINDTYGHPAGDMILKEMASRLKVHLRAVDIVARYGGEEFSMLLPQTDAETARMVAERIRADVEQNPFETENGALNITISIGVCDTKVKDFKNGGELLNLSDKALYQAKSSGRNKTVIYDLKTGS